ncbi:YbaK/EbsC family protein [Jidongwangia harbinensis]|uniref:YbaK/EbsC family protein n=1 Tax=Jidongwangia harbinensis TaxID=2878561 RepID=UPI001CD95C6B|nr:YbaK/EbsC family protein [Jidongwangia harbinensis]MCA2211546.1 YbaK/prolyl-tRNA synthetase associated domain-containing protein [Jidongwangia harbinensis]
MSTTGELSAYDRIVRLLDEYGADYHLIEHEPEGQTEAASEIRGHDLVQAAKSIVILARPDKRTTRFILAVVPGNRRVDLRRLKKIMYLRSVGFAPREVAERLAGSVAGSIMPFAFHPELDLIVDEEMLRQDVLYFNAGRLDLSVGLSTKDYIRMAQPRTARIAE